MMKPTMALCCALLLASLTAATAQERVKRLGESAATPEKPLQIAVELRDGSRLVGVPSIMSLPLKTAFAKMDLPLKLIESIEFADDKETAKILCTNGDELNGIINLTAITVGTAFDKVSVPLKNIARISTEAGGVKRGRVLYYPFDKDEGAKVTDRSGQGNHGTNHGAQWTKDGAIGGAMEFDGRASIDLGDLSAVENQSALSWGAWVWITGSGDLNGVMGKTTDHDEVFYLCMSPSSFGCYIVPEGRSEERTAGGKGCVERSTWIHLMGTYDGKQVNAYCNGKLVASSRVFDRKPTNSNRVPAAVGDVAYRRGWRFRGKIDEVMIFDRVLTAAEIQQLYRLRKATADSE